MRAADNERVSVLVKALYSLVNLARGNFFFELFRLKFWYHFTRYKPLRSFLRSRGSFKNLKKGQRVVLLATSTSRDSLPTSVEIVLARALHLAGCRTVLTYCSGSFACNLCNTQTLKRDTNKFIASDSFNPFCDSCSSVAKNYLAGSDWLEVLDLTPPNVRNVAVSNFEDVKASSLGFGKYDLSKINSKLGFDSFYIFDHAKAATLKFFAVDIFDHTDSDHTRVLERFIYSSLVYAVSIKQLVGEHKVTDVVLNHGIYVPQGVIADTCRQLGVNVICWNLAYRRNTFIFAHGQSYHHDMVKNIDVTLDAITWSPDKEKLILNYLRERQVGESDWLTFQDNKNSFESPENQLRENQDYSKTLAVFTNVAWDAQVHFEENVYPSMRSWLQDIVEYAVAHPDVLVVVRVHPAEKRGLLPSRTKVVDMIPDGAAENIKNLMVIDADSKITSYDVASVANAVCVYGSKIGIELAPFKPVVVCGEAWVRNKGIAIEVMERRQLGECLNQALNSKVSSAQRTRALKVAYYVFFLRFMEINVFEQSLGHYPPFKIKENLLDNDLLEDRGLQAFVNAIENKSEFIRSDL